MSSTLQELTALIVVAAAAAFIAHKAWTVLARKRTGGCGGGCPKCATNAEDAEPKVISLELGQPTRKPIG